MRATMIIGALLACSACSTELRATYLFNAQPSYRDTPTEEEAVEPKRSELLVRCTEDTPRTCIFEDEHASLELELANRAPWLSIENETDDEMIVRWDEARFVLPNGRSAKLELFSSYHGQTLSRINSREVLRTRLNPEGEWEERCVDISEYNGPTKRGPGHVFGTYHDPVRRDGTRSSAVGGCTKYPKGILPDWQRPPTGGTVRREALTERVGQQVRLVLPLEVEGELFEYVLTFEVESVELSEIRVASSM